jgi:F-type H+-transporting ATPase subunit c
MSTEKAVSFVSSDERMENKEMMMIRKLLAMTAVLAVASPAFAEEAAGAASGQWATVAKAIALAIAILGGTFGQGRVASAALEGMARNPQANLQTPMILGLALVESLVLMAFLNLFF